MKIRFKKLTGWVLLLAGVAIILWGLYSSYNIFTAKVLAPEIFESKKHSTVLEEDRTGGIDEQIIQEMIGEELKGIFPPDALSQLLNLVSWSIFAGILIFGGSQLAALGIKLIKK